MSYPKRMNQAFPQTNTGSSCEAQEDLGENMKLIPCTGRQTKCRVLKLQEFFFL